jgi:hypothetical protein
VPDSRIRLNVWTPLEQPWDSPLSPQDEESFAESAVISGVAPTDSAVTALLADNPALFVNAQRLARA